MHVRRNKHGFSRSIPVKQAYEAFRFFHRAPLHLDLFALYKFLNGSLTEIQLGPGLSRQRQHNIRKLVVLARVIKVFSNGPTYMQCFLACVAWGGLGSGHSNILKNREKTPKNTSISVLIDQFSCKNWPIKDGGR